MREIIRSEPLAAILGEGGGAVITKSITLKDVEKAVLSLREQGKTYVAIARELNISFSRVQTAHRKALHKSKLQDIALSDPDSLAGLSVRASNICCNNNIHSKSQLRFELVEGRFLWLGRWRSIRNLGKQTLLEMLKFCDVDFSLDKPKKVCPHCGKEVAS